MGDDNKGGRELRHEAECPPPPQEAHLEAIDVQDGDGQCLLRRGDQRVDPGDEPLEQQRIQDLGDGIPGAETVMGVGTGVGTGVGLAIGRLREGGRSLTWHPRRSPQSGG